MDGQIYHCINWKSWRLVCVYRSNEHCTYAMYMYTESRLLFFLHLHMLPQCKQTGFSDFEKKGFRENGFLQYFSVSLSKNDYLIQIPEETLSIEKWNNLCNKDCVWISLKQNDCQHFLYNTPSMYRHVRIIGYVHYCRVTALGGVMYPRQINPSADGGKINPSERYPSSW